MVATNQIAQKSNISPITTAGWAIATPPGKPSGLASLVTARTLPYWAARVGISLARTAGGPIRLGSTVIAARHADVCEALSRDLDFVIRPNNAAKFDQIGYHFILGMDRSAELIAERRALYAALASVDVAALQQSAAQDIAARLDNAAGNKVDIIENYARPVAAATASRLLGLAPDDNASFMDAARAIFGNSFLNVSSDQAMTDRALAAAALLSNWFDAEIAQRLAAPDPGHDMMGALLRSGASPDCTRRTLGGMLVGAIDTTATVVAKVMCVLVGDRSLLARASADRGDPALMWGWCNEALRRWPHGPIMVRKAARDTVLAGTRVMSGETVILWTEAAMLDPAAFPEPLALRPDRPQAAYLHLGGGLHPCAGRGVNAWQIPMLVSALLERQPTRLGKLRWAGPFPAQLDLDLKGRPA